MAYYYYLISSLPTLDPKSSLPISYAQFLSLCKGTVSDALYSELENLKLSSDGNALVSKWHSYYIKLNQEVNYRRAENLNKPQHFEKQIDSDIIRVVDDVFRSKNPLEAEKIMLKAQFEFLDSAMSMHYFDSFILFGYALKIKLMERQSLFNYEMGKEEFETLFTSVGNIIQEL